MDGNNLACSIISISPPMQVLCSSGRFQSVGEQFGLDLQLPQCLLNNFNVEIKTSENLLNIDKKAPIPGSFSKGRIVLE